MFQAASEHELLEKLMVDVEIIKQKLPLLDKISDCLAKLKENCHLRHEQLEQTRLNRHEKHEARISGLETSVRVTEALFRNNQSATTRQKALFWSAVVAVSTSAQVLATVIFHILSK